MVPLKPKELTPPARASDGTDASTTGREQTTAESALPTCGLSTRSSAFGVASLPSRLCTSLSSPVIPAAGSACPMLAFTPTSCNGTTERDRSLSVAAASDPASIGSPSAVPVPCASLMPRELLLVRASARADSSSPRWACPFGAVRLADRPSCCTALPSMVNDGDFFACCAWVRAAVQQDSERP